jgi:hypothetical protein
VVDASDCDDRIRARLERSRHAPGPAAAPGVAAVLVSACHNASAALHKLSQERRRTMMSALPTANGRCRRR